ncbi:hypothetical protein R1flu_005410 [Riccia fluitans]|uniref:Uncharacterized protein n=1 Tax=Riccia fluitans TaxID=41844 RepID=A0ABD1YT38_9MARC
MGSEQPSRKHPRFESIPKDGNKGNLPSAIIPNSSHRLEASVAVDEVVVETSRKGKEKVTESSHLPNVDIAAEDRRRLKIGLKASCLEMDPPFLTPIGQISEHHGRANQRLASLEEDLIHAKREEEKLKATIEALERKKSEMNARVALMERKELYELLEAKMEGF